MASGALRTYLLASWLAAPFASPLLARRRARGKEDPDRMGERLGHASAPRPDGKIIWLHGASVGEAMSILPLGQALDNRAAGPVTCLVTTGTVTAARRMADVLPDGVLHQYVPVDTAPAVRRFLDHWRPDLAVWVESELWPRLLHETHRRGVPMALVNARMSERSHARWQRAPKMARALLSAFRLILTQDGETLERLRSLGITGQYGGNLKSLVPPPDCPPEMLAEMRLRLSRRKIWLAASTHPGEEELVLAAHAKVRERHPQALLILAPRHPERGGEIAGLLDRAGVAWARRSTGEMPTPGTSVWLADTLGEMGIWYRMAPVTFVGGSLVPVGGHTPFEPVMIGSVVIHGPETTNFAPTYADLDAARGAAKITTADDLGAITADLLADDERRAQMVLDAAEAHFDMKPDVDAMADALLDLMSRPARVPA